MGYNYDTGMVSDCGNYCNICSTTEEYGQNGGAGYSGGITSANKGKVEKCYNIGEINGYSDRESIFIGGIVGQNLSTITFCYNIGNLLTNQDRNYVGGIIGNNLNDEALIAECVYNNFNILGIGKENEENIEGITYDSTLDFKRIMELLK